MWIHTLDGFFSAVADRSDPDFILVRARLRSDLERLGTVIATEAPLYTPLADYPWRIRVPRRFWVSYVSRSADSVDYDNFKEAAVGVLGDARGPVLLSVWAELMRLEGEEGVDARRYRWLYADDDDDNFALVEG